jgi:uridine kinase
MSKTTKEIFIDRYGNNKLKEVFNSNIFWIGLFIKVILAFTLASNFLTDLFIPFTDYYISSGFSNPYKHFINIDQANAFPYPALMLYIVSIPRMIFGIFTDWSTISSSTIFLARLPILLADFLILVLLSRLIKEHTKKILIYYWLSPILIYINYIHGQLDVIPVSILFVSLYFLFKRKFGYSSIFLGLAIAAKTNMVMVLPFYFAYLLYSKTINIKQLSLNLLIVVASFILVNLPYLFSYEFIEMVFNNKEQVKIFDFSYNFPDGNILYFVPLAYLFLFITAINLKGFSKDVYMMFLGFSFGIIALMVSPMQGWYYWIIPFFIYFHSKRPNSKFDFTLILFLGLQIAYFVYFLLIKNSDYLEVLQIIAPNLAKTPNAYQSLQLIGIDADKISNLSFTLLQAMLLANCIFIYRSGIKSYANYKIFSHPFLLGICGDSGAGKTTISNSIESIFKNRNTTIIRGDDMHKWERGNDNWNNFTHLNPKSNFLHDEISYLKAIKNSETISRRNYDHDTGKFTKEKRFKTGNLVIFEGLHSFYIKQMRDLYDLKIFVNPSEKLRKQWKIDRDTKKRGYSKDKILKQLDSRQKDSEKFIKAQLKYADIIVELLNDKEVGKDNELNIILKITATNSFYLEPLFNELSSIKSINSKHEYEDEDRQFIEINGNLSVQEIDNIAYNLSLNLELEDLGINNPSWDKDYLGIIQLFISYCIMKNLEATKK